MDTRKTSLDLSKLVPVIKEANQTAFAKIGMVVVGFLVLFKINMIIYLFSYFFKFKINEAFS